MPSFRYPSAWWLITGAWLLACGGRSGELYDDSVTSTSTTLGAGGSQATGGTSVGGSGNDGGSNGFGGSGGSGGSGFGGSSGSGFGGQAFGGNGGSAFGGNGGSAFGGNGGSAFGGSGGSGGSGFGGSGGSGFGGSGGGSGGDGGSGVGGSGGSGGEGPLQCLGCLAQECPAFIECLTDEPCYDGLVCTTNKCFDSAAPPLCILDCHDGDLARVQNLAEILACAVSSCSNRCNFN